jgi:hypothetical protein
MLVTIFSSERIIKKMKKIILCLLFTLALCNLAHAIEYYGTPMYCRVQIEYSDKENVIRQIIEDMEEEGYRLIQRSHIFLLFETPLRKSNRFNYATTFGQHWIPTNMYGWRREELSSPVYQLSITIVKKTISSVEVEITPIIIWNPGNAYQEEIFEYLSKTEKAINEYLSSLKSRFVYENK